MYQWMKLDERCIIPRWFCGFGGTTGSLRKVEVEERSKREAVEEREAAEKQLLTTEERVELT